jgi:hypothetical protein
MPTDSWNAISRRPFAGDDPFDHFRARAQPKCLSELSPAGGSRRIAAGPERSTQIRHYPDLPPTALSCRIECASVDTALAAIPLSVAVPGG